MHSSTSTALALPLPQLPIGADGQGKVIAQRYRLERLLGEGGMGSVWLARNMMLDLPVALKIVRPEVRGSDTCGRLLTEARVEASLGHPNVVRVFDCGITDDGDAFIVMELLEGCSLGDLLHDQGALRPEFAVQLLLPVIQALSTAHQAGVIHRDLKPDNIFISRTGAQLCPKILDFGIAKLNAPEGVTPSLHETGRGMVMGSPAYMAPEQVRGCTDLDARADVWALSVVLYEALTGKMAFDADNYNAVLCEVLERDLPPLLDPDRAGVWAIVRRGLARDRQQRIGSMRELGTLLANWLISRGVNDDASGEPLAWHWCIGSAPEREPAPALPKPRVTTTDRADDSGIRSALTEKLVTKPPARFQLRPGAMGLGVCIGLQLLMLGSSLHSNFRDDDSAEGRVLAAATVPSPAQAATVLPTPGPAPDARRPIRTSAAPARSLPPAAVAPAHVQRANAPSAQPADSGDAPEATPREPAIVSERAIRTRAAAKRGSTPASSARARESDLGLKSPW
jgi:serine/threonine protein kinase